MNFTSFRSQYSTSKHSDLSLVFCFVLLSMQYRIYNVLFKMFGIALLFRKRRARNMTFSVVGFYMHAFLSACCSTQAFKALLEVDTFARPFLSLFGDIEIKHSCSKIYCFSHGDSNSVSLFIPVSLMLISSHISGFQI